MQQNSSQKPEVVNGTGENIIPRKNFETTADIAAALPSISYVDPLSFKPTDLHGNLLADAHTQIQRRLIEVEKKQSSSITILYGPKRAGKSSLLFSIRDLNNDKSIFIDCAGSIQWKETLDSAAEYIDNQVRKKNRNPDDNKIILFDELEILSPDLRQALLDKYAGDKKHLFVTATFPNTQLRDEYLSFAQAHNIDHARINLISTEVDWIKQGRLNSYISRIMVDRGIRVVTDQDFLEEMGGLTGFRVYDVVVILDGFFGWLKTHPELIKRGPLFDLPLNLQLLNKYIHSPEFEEHFKNTIEDVYRRFWQKDMTQEEREIVQQGKDGVQLTAETRAKIQRLIPEDGVDYFTVDNGILRPKEKLFAQFLGIADI